MKSIHFLEATVETFVEFEILPKFKKSVETVETRDLQSLKIPSEATRFQFFDVIKAKFKIGTEDVILEKRINHSPVYWPGASVMLGPGGMGGQVRILDKSPVWRDVVDDNDIILSTYEQDVPVLIEQLHRNYQTPPKNWEALTDDLSFAEIIKKGLHALPMLYRDLQKKPTWEIIMALRNLPFNEEFLSKQEALDLKDCSQFWLEKMKLQIKIYEKYRNKN